MKKRLGHRGLSKGQVFIRVFFCLVIVGAAWIFHQQEVHKTIRHNAIVAITAYQSSLAKFTIDFGYYPDIVEFCGGKIELNDSLGRPYMANYIISSPFKEIYYHEDDWGLGYFIAVRTITNEVFLATPKMIRQVRSDTVLTSKSPDIHYTDGQPTFL